MPIPPAAYTWKGTPDRKGSGRIFDGKGDQHDEVQNYGNGDQHAVVKTHKINGVTVTKTAVQETDGHWTYHMKTSDGGNAYYDPETDKWIDDPK